MDSPAYLRRLPEVMGSKRRHLDDSPPAPDTSACDVELQPLTKKLKSTHLDQEMISDSSSHSTDSAYSSTTPGGPNPVQLGSTTAGSGFLGAVPANNIEEEDRMDIVYQPELDETSNPFYYSLNRVLHDAYVERIRRSKL